MSNKLIYIDAGHDKTDPGAVSGSIKEYDLNCKVAKSCADYLKGYDCNVILDTDSTIGDNCRKAAANKASAFLCIHHNSGGGKGGEVFFWNGDNNAKDLASLIAQQFKATGQRLRSEKGYPEGVKPSSPQAYNFGVCRLNSANGIPAILGEFGFVDGKADQKLLTDDGLKKEGEAYAKAVIAFLGIKPKAEPVVDKSFSVKIINPLLNIRKKPTVLSSVIGTIPAGKVKVISEVVGTWGKLKDEPGYISVKSAYVKKM